MLAIYVVINESQPYATASKACELDISRLREHSTVFEFAKFM
jgi:hypothetical protein